MPAKKKAKKVEPEEEDIEDQEEEEEVSYEEDDDSDDEYDPTQEEDDIKGRSSKGKKGRKRGRRGGSSSEEEELEDDDDDVEYRPNRKPKAAGRPKKGRTRSGEFDDSKAKRTSLSAASKRGRKRKNMPLEEVEDDEEEEEIEEEVKQKAEVKQEVKKKETKKGGTTPLVPALKKSKSTSDWSSIDLSSDAKTPDGKPWTHKFSSWNVNGVRAWLKNEALQYVHEECPDIFCIQETKCSESDLPKDELEVPGYHTYWNSADQKGYSGTGLYSKEEPLKVTYGIGVDKHDKEGRVITAEYEKFYFITVYVPNAGDKLKRLDYRVNEWDPDFKNYLQTLDKNKPIVMCGDLNVAHHEIDIANPKTNLKSAGFTKEERESFTKLLEESKFKDSFRTLYPEQKDAYSYWSYRSNARTNNKGWRLDYFVLSERLQDNLCDSIIRSQVYGSDHCPIVLLLAL